MSADDYAVLLKTLIYSFNDTFEENRMLASKSFLTIVNLGHSRSAFSEYDRLKAIAMAKSSSNNPHDCAVAYTIMRTLLGVHEYALGAGQICAELVERLAASLTAIRDTRDLIRMATTCPIYSTLFCVRQLLHDYGLSIIATVSIDTIIDLCYRVNDLIFPFIASAAPEGCLPEDIGRWVESHPIECHPEYLTICCWRSCKEVSLILAHLSSTMLDSQSPQHHASIAKIAEFFFSQLVTVTHKGAFESLSVGFERLCHSLWRSSTPSLVDITRDFIRRSVDILLLNEDLCATRRSAGLPHLFLVLITTEPVVNKQRSSLSSVMADLHAILSRADASHSGDQKRIVHVFNILRVIYKESALLAQVVAHTFTSVKYSVQFFYSNCWPLRNAATLLYCSLIERIFGPSKTIKFHNKFSRLNSKIFFNRYPPMYEFITEYLEQCQLDPLNLATSTKVYPVLIILGRLVPESDDFHNTPFDLSTIKAHIFRYLHSPIWIVRVSTAKAIAALSHGQSSSIESINILISQVTSSQVRRHNFLHGSIKTIRCIVEDLLDNLFIPDEQLELLQDTICSIWCQLSPLVLFLSNHSPCQSEFVELMELIWKKSPLLLNKIQFLGDFHHIEYSWQIKLLVIVCSLNSQNAELKESLMKSLRNEDYLLRSELLSQICDNSHLITQYFTNDDAHVLFEMMSSECHPSVDYLWFQFIDLFLGTVAGIDESSIRGLLEFLQAKLRSIQSELRAKTLCAVMELLGTVYRIVLARPCGMGHEFAYFVDAIVDSCVYETDAAIRISCAKSISSVMDHLDMRDGIVAKIVEILMIQLNDELADIRNLAALSFGKLLRCHQMDRTVASVVQAELVNKALQQYPDIVQHLTDKSPLGFKHKPLCVEKDSVFDSEEINFYYDFLDVHSYLELNVDGSKRFVLEHPVEGILNDGSAFAKTYQMTLLNK